MTVGTDDILTFAAVAESGSFAGAARHLGRDASVLSRRLTILERRLGVRLLVRSTRHISLTEAGAGYLARVQAILADLADADAEVSLRATKPRGVLRIAVPGAFGRMWVAPSLSAFLSAYPEIQIEAQFTDHGVDVVAERLDAAIRLGPLAASAMVAKQLATYARVLCASPAYFAAKGIPATPHDLVNHACLGFLKHRFWPVWPLQRGSELVEVRVTGPLVASDGEALVAATVRGSGILLAPEWLVGRELADGRLIAVLAEWSVSNGDPVSVILPPGRLIPAKTRAFVDWLAAAFLPSPPWQRATSASKL